jgi:hypothetical protein
MLNLALRKPRYKALSRRIRSAGRLPRMPKVAATNTYQPLRFSHSDGAGSLVAGGSGGLVPCPPGGDLEPFGPHRAPEALQCARFAMAGNGRNCSARPTIMFSAATTSPSLPKSPASPWRVSCGCGWTAKRRCIFANARCSASIPTLRPARQWRGMIGARWPGRHPPVLNDLSREPADSSTRSAPQLRGCGALWLTRGERVSVARLAGAKLASAIDVAPSGNSTWVRCREHCRSLGVFRGRWLCCDYRERVCKIDLSGGGMLFLPGLNEAMRKILNAYGSG